MTVRPLDQAKWGRSLRRWHEAEQRAQGFDMTLKPFEVWRSRDFLVQFFREHGFVRMTVNRTHMPNGHDWADGITWDQLQALKAEAGRGEMWAVEIYPAEGFIVNDAHMRHLWLLAGPPPFAWTDGVRRWAESSHSHPGEES